MFEISFYYSYFKGPTFFFLHFPLIIREIVQRRGAAASVFLPLYRRLVSEAGYKYPSLGFAHRCQAQFLPRFLLPLIVVEGAEDFKCLHPTLPQLQSWCLDGVTEGGAPSLESAAISGEVWLCLRPQWQMSWSLSGMEENPRDCERRALWGGVGDEHLPGDPPATCWWQATQGSGQARALRAGRVESQCLEHQPWVPSLARTAAPGCPERGGTRLPL